MSNNKQQPKPENPNNQFSNTEPLTHAQRVAIANTMSNNKQSMKLYTEEQVIDIFEKYGNMSAINARNIIDLSESIELPSDEEIHRESEVLYPINKGGSMWMPSRYDIDKNNRQEGFLEGAKWMRDKIQGGNQ